MQEGNRVYCKNNGKYGEITTIVPGNGTFPWYFVLFEDGTEDRFVAEDLEVC